MNEGGEGTSLPPERRLLGGLSTPASARWTMKISLPTQTELIGKYERFRPAQINDLRRSLLAEYKDSDYRTMTIACFGPHDETVFLYGDRASLGPIVLQVFWDLERGWITAGFLDRPEDRKSIAELSEMIQAISCSRIAF